MSGSCFQVGCVNEMLMTVTNNDQTETCKVAAGGRAATGCFLQSSTWFVLVGKGKRATTFLDWSCHCNHASHPAQGSIPGCFRFLKRTTCLSHSGALKPTWKSFTVRLIPPPKHWFCFQHERIKKDPFDWLQDSDSPLLHGVGVIINCVLNPEVSLVSRCQARLCPEGVICSHSSAPLPICLERRNNGFSITLCLSHIHALSLHHYLSAYSMSCVFLNIKASVSLPRVLFLQSLWLETTYCTGGIAALELSH